MHEQLLELLDLVAGQGQCVAEHGPDDALVAARRGERAGVAPPALRVRGQEAARAEARRQLRRPARLRHGAQPGRHMLQLDVGQVRLVLPEQNGDHSQAVVLAQSLLQAGVVGVVVHQMQLQREALPVHQVL